jgi:hypothetical protein
MSITLSKWSIAIFRPTKMLAITYASVQLITKQAMHFGPICERENNKDKACPIDIYISLLEG